jgi:Ca-activated chloride channel family protein
MRERNPARLAAALGAAACVFLLAAAAPHEDALRAGNAAFARGDYEAALRHYAEAEAATADPGQVAFNQAAALYQLGRFAEAAEHYERALEDAEAGRRARACYGLANALAHLGRGATGRPATRLLEQSLAYYHEALELDPALADAQANRATVQALLEYKRAMAALEEQNPEKPPEKPRNGDANKPQAGAKPDRGSSGTQRKPIGASGKPTDGAKPQLSDLIRAGQGNLRPIPPTAQGTPLNRSQAMQHLQADRQRMLDDRANRLPDTLQPFKQERDY